MQKNNIPKIGERVEKASRFVIKNEKLLDVGCGDGIIHYFVKDKVKNIYGIDNSKIDLVKAKKRGMIVQSTNLDEGKFPFESGFFNFVTCLDVVEHVKDPRILIKEIYRVLKEDGILILSTPNVRFSDHLFKLIFRGIFPKTSEDDSLYDGGHIHFFTFKDIRILLTEIGFRSLKEEGIINKEKRGWKGRLLEKILGVKFMLEFRTPGILLIAKK